MTATLPAVRELRGTHLSLTPIVDADLPGLWRAIGRPEVFASGYHGGPAALPADLAGFRDFAAAHYRDDETGTSWVVRLAHGPDAGTIVGTSTLFELDLRNEGAHVGSTAYDPRVWGTVVNAEAKLLLLGLAFDHGFSRVKIQADAANARSRAAIAKLGAQFEGVLRHDRRRADGSWRDTAVYSVLVEEWPEVRAGLEARVAAWGERPVELG